ncbi:MAG TPA: hypothetical protein VD995_12665 [Azospirillum sp.]|nr:hypothetical protein [Azospirillum sp.]
MARDTPAAARKPLLITIDTEGDDQWSAPRRITCRNAAFIPRFQELCERYGFRPTYLTTFEMASNGVFVEFAADALKRGAAEVGMHLHAWHSPPDHPLTANDHALTPYLIEYPDHVMRAKIQYLTAWLEDTFSTRMTSHRAGRWALDARYARMLVEHGYTVDCSVTPYVDWTRMRGATRGGVDYRAFPTHPYCMDLDDIGRPGTSGLLELPMSIRPRRFDPVHGPLGRLFRAPSAYRAAGRFAAIDWLRPNGRNRAAMIGLAARLWRSDAPYAQFALHSSELMPGGSPTFRTAEDIERLYRDLEALFDAIAPHYAGCTLREFARGYALQPAACPDEPALPRAAVIR